MDVSQNDPFYRMRVESLIAALYIDAGIYAAETLFADIGRLKPGQSAIVRKTPNPACRKWRWNAALTCRNIGWLNGPDLTAPQMTYEVQLDEMALARQLLAIAKQPNSSSDHAAGTDHRHRSRKRE